MQYRLASLMVVVFVAAVLCGIALKGSFIAFGIGFVAVILLMMQLMTHSPARPVAIEFTRNEAEAHMLRNYLSEHGIDARVEHDQSVPMYFCTGFQILVPQGQAARTQELLQGFRERA